MSRNVIQTVNKGLFRKCKQRLETHRLTTFAFRSTKQTSHSRLRQLNGRNRRQRAQTRLRVKTHLPLSHAVLAPRRQAHLQELRHPRLGEKNRVRLHDWQSHAWRQQGPVPVRLHQPGDGRAPLHSPHSQRPLRPHQTHDDGRVRGL